MTRTKREPLFKLESELCAAFIAALPEGWTAYPETGGWDILLVRRRDGFQIGIEAKLTFNPKVLNQAIERYVGYWVPDVGPDCRAVLVPQDEGDLGAIAAYIGVTVIRVGKVDPYSYYRKEGCDWQFHPRLPGEAHGTDSDRWFEWAPDKRQALPNYVPDVAAGSAAPVQLTDWKIKAIKLAILLRRRGFVTKADFKHIHLDHRRFTERGSGWLDHDPNGRPIYTSKTFADAMEKQHPRNFKEIEADFETWAPPAPAVEAEQMRLT